MWTKLDDHLHSNLKVVECWRENRGALGLHLLALSHAGQYERDGLISTAFVEEKVPKAAERRKLVGVLVRVGLWDQLEHGWRVHDYLHDNLTRKEIQARRAADAKRKALARNTRLLAVVRRRDGAWCRYCATGVSFEQRRNGDGATYNLVDPDGPVNDANVVIACKSCRDLKGSLSAAEAGLSLLPPPAPQLPLSARTSHGRPTPSPFDVRSTRPDPTRPDPKGAVQR